VSVFRTSVMTMMMRQLVCGYRLLSSTTLTTDSVQYDLYSAMLIRRR